MSHVLRNRALPVMAACLATAVLAQPAWGQNPSKGKTTVACKRLHPNHIRCSMTIKGGGAITGTVTMRITRRTLLVAKGHGRVTRGRAMLTMRVLHSMTSGAYTVRMAINVTATRVLRLK